MFLALDIGNSATKLGLFDGDVWTGLERLDSDAGELSEELSSRLANADVQAAGIASVVPQLTDQAKTAVRMDFGVDPIIVSAELPLPFEMGYETPETLGADRLAAASAAWIHFGRREGRSVIAVDAGTAVTTEVISGDGVYLGGAIAPGPDAIRRALVRDTAQLPEISWPDAPEPIGSSTHAAISAGVSIMFLCGVRGLLEGSANKLKKPPFIVATGGWAEWLDRHLDAIDVVEPDLVLDGIRLLAA